MLTTDYLPNIGGIAAHVYNLSHALQQLGHRVAVINPVAGETAGLGFEGDEIPLLRVAINSEQRRFRNKIYRKHLFGLAAKEGIHAAIERFGAPHIVHQHDYQDSTSAGAAWSKRVPWVWTNHSSRFLRDYERPMKMQYIKKSYRKVTGFIAVSEELRDKTAALWPASALAYIANGVDTARFHDQVHVDRAAYGLQAEDVVVLCPRRMARKNGVLFLAQAVATVLAAAPEINWKFVFLGSEQAVNTHSDYIDEIKKLLHSEHADGRVVYLGNIPLHKMPEVNALADIVMMPSLMEAVSLSALEAMATGAVLVASDVGGLPEIVCHEQTGLLVPPRDPAPIATALVRLGRDPQLRDQLAAAGQQLAQDKYSWQAAAQKTLDFYRQLQNT
ncbi:MAG: glycosyltransferase family 4 protein [Pseudomonadales bacterium]